MCRILFTCEFKEDIKSGVNILAALKDKFVEMGFSSHLFDKLIFVTDQGANIVNALNLNSNKRYNCTAHIINIVLKNSFLDNLFSDNSNTERRYKECNNSQRKTIAVG